MNILSFINMRLIASTIVGGFLGYAMYKRIGCSTGACPITSNPKISILYGAFLGFLIGR